jgi:hypothetical protein
MAKFPMQCVKNESAPPYEVQILSEEENVIAQGRDISLRRMRKTEELFSLPSAVSDFLRVKLRSSFEKNPNISFIGQR